MERKSFMKWKNQAGMNPRASGSLQMRSSAGLSISAARRTAMPIAVRLDWFCRTSHSFCRLVSEPYGHQANILENVYLVHDAGSIRLHGYGYYTPSRRQSSKQI